MSINLTALQTYLAPLETVFAEDGVNEICINKPGEIWVEKKGDIRREELASLDFEHLSTLARLIASALEQKISESTPLLSATLPNGYRVQIVIPPACEVGSIAFAIRKPMALQLSLDDYEKMGLFDDVVTTAATDKSDYKLAKLLRRGKIKEFIELGVISKKNIIVSGGTSTGKTTFTNTLLQIIPQSERIVTCEDAREISLKQPNRLHLLASKGGQGRALVTMQDLIEACLRLRPDRIIVGELRGSEAFSFLRAINTGHPGSISTLHADAPAMALEQLKLMVMQAGLGLPADSIADYISHIIDIVIQLRRGEHGKRYISEIFFKNAHLNDKDE